MNDLSEIFDNHKKSVVDFIDGVRNEAYKQGRKDALEDALSVVEWDGYTLVIKKRIERLKEQQNE